MCGGKEGFSLSAVNFSRVRVVSIIAIYRFRFQFYLLFVCVCVRIYVCLEYFLSIFVLNEPNCWNWCGEARVGPAATASMTTNCYRRLLIRHFYYSDLLIVQWTFVNSQFCLFFSLAFFFPVYLGNSLFAAIKSEFRVYGIKKKKNIHYSSLSW